MTLIDLDDLKYRCEHPDYTLYNGDMLAEWMEHCIVTAPIIVGKHIRHGHWTEERTGKDMYDYRFQCSECKGYTPDKAYTIAPDFCPNCGAKMDGGKENV